MRVRLRFEASQVRAVNAVTGEWVCVGEFTKVMALLYGRFTVVQ